LRLWSRRPRNEKTPQQVAGFLTYREEVQELFHIHSLLAHISAISSYLPAVLITLGIVTLVGCAIGCICSPCEEKDDLFHRRTY
jgi:hypothetical protein